MSTRPDAARIWSNTAGIVSRLPMSQTQARASMPCFARCATALFELVLLARSQRQPRAHFAQRFGDLQPEAARAAGDDGDAPGQVEKLLDTHARSPSMRASMLTTTNRPIYTRAQLDRLVAPKSIAIVGASPRAGSFGLRTLENLANFKGAVWPVNAKYPKIGAYECFPSLAALPGKPDLVALVVPREGVETALTEAAAAGAGGVVVYASGYGEMARDEGAAAQRRLSDIARAARMPMLGPNCMGLVNHELGVGVSFIPEYSSMPRRVGPIAFVSQSGALGYCLAQAAERGLGYRYFFSVGNSCDVDVADLIGAMAQDPGVRAIACLFEGVPDARRLLEAGARAKEAGKPVIVYKLGESEDGAAAARSHTGSMAGSAAAFRALFDRAGFAVVDNYEALVEYAKFFAAAGKPLAKGVAVVSGLRRRGHHLRRHGGAPRRADAAAHGEDHGGAAQRGSRVRRRAQSLRSDRAGAERARVLQQVLPGAARRSAIRRAAVRDERFFARNRPETVHGHRRARALAAQADRRGLGIGVAAGPGLGSLRGGRPGRLLPLHGPLLCRDRRLAALA